MGDHGAPSTLPLSKSRRFSRGRRCGMIPTRMSGVGMRFDFAISFAGPQRNLGRELAEALVAKGCRVFFDEHFEHEMLGRDGADYLNDIFFRQSHFCVALISQSYQERAWTQLERRAAQARELETGPGFLLPVIVDGSRPDWLLPTRIHFDLQQRSMSDLIGLLERKMREKGLGRYRLVSRFDHLFDEGLLAVTAVEGTGEYLAWCTMANIPPQPLYRIHREAGSWQASQMGLAARGRRLLATEMYVVVVPEFADESIDVHSRSTGEQESTVIPRVGEWRSCVDCDGRGGQLVLAYCGGDAWLLDLAEMRHQRLQGDSGTTDYPCVALITPKDSAAVAFRHDVRVYSLADATEARHYESSGYVFAMRYAASSNGLVIAGPRSLCMLDLETGSVAWRQSLAGGTAWSLVCPREANLVACIAGRFDAPNVLSLYAAQTGLLLGQLESGYESTWGQVEVADGGASVVAVQETSIHVFER